MARLFILAMLVAACSSSVACQQRHDHSSAAACPVTGKVVIEGHKPLGVYVQFHPLDPANKRGTEGAKTRGDGSFVARLQEPGEYAVTVFWPEVTTVEGEQLEGQDRFKGKHDDRENPVLKVTIQPGPNTLPPIKLKL